jgi:hypothetical protein
MKKKDKSIDDYMKELDQLEAAGELDDDEPLFHGEVLDLVKWDLYQCMTRLLLCLPDQCRSVLKVDYLSAPIPTDEFAKTTVTLSQAAMLDGQAKEIIAVAALRCDRFFITAIGGKTRLNFLIDNIWSAHT